LPMCVLPTDTPPPLTETGTLAFTPFWLVLAEELALCVVLEFCPSPWAWPEPPQPALAVWVVALELEAREPAELLADWLAPLCANAGAAGTALSLDLIGLVSFELTSNG
jgi:hypothetical protein